MMAKIPLGADLLPATEDGVFKSLFCRDDAKARFILADLISCIIGRRVADVVVRNNEPAIMDIQETRIRYDINCIDAVTKEQFDIEMNASRMVELAGATHKNAKGRSVYYACDMHAGQKVEVNNYAALPRSFQITFFNYIIDPGNPSRYLQIGSIKNQDGEEMSDAINIIFIEIPKVGRLISKPIEELSELEKWSLFLGNAHRVEHHELINGLIEAKEEISMASELLQSISKDEIERARFRSRRMFENDLLSERNTWRMLVDLAKGEAELAKEEAVLAKGEAELAREEAELAKEKAMGEILAIARKLLVGGMPIVSVAHATNLPLDIIIKMASDKEPQSS